MKHYEFAHVNIRSLTSGFNYFKDFVDKHEYDVIGLYETWLNSDISDDLLSIDGYRLIRKDRVTRGGGVALYIKSNLHFKQIYVNVEGNEIENLWVSLKINGESLALGVLYKPPNINLLSSLEQLDNMLSVIIPQYKSTIWLGDLNINVLHSQANNAIKLKEILDTYELLQHISEPTRITQNSQTLIDLIVTTKNIEITDAGCIPMHDMSDHNLIYCKLAKYKSKIHKYHTYRDFSKFNNETFLQDLDNINWQMYYRSNSSNFKVDFLNTSITTLFDRHAPLVTARITKKPAPWLTDVIKLLIKRRDYAHTRFKRTKSPVDWESYKSLKNYTNSAIKREKYAFARYKTGSNNSKDNWDTIRQLGIATKNNIDIPNQLNDINQINDYFVNKSIANISDCQQNINKYSTHMMFENNTFHFKIATSGEIQNILNTIKSSARGCDGLNIRMIRLCLPNLLPQIIHLINFCIEQNAFPTKWKEAYVTPIPKNNKPEEFSDLRPISILSVLSKILEKVLNRQITEYIINNNILPECQSGFVQGKSTITALAKITDDIIRATDKNEVTALVLLDFSKAFDTINHDLLCAKLKYIGFCEQAIIMMRNYLSGRIQRVKLNDCISNSLPIRRGVPQGSILGPLLYNIYTHDLKDITNNTKIHYYADDSQLYKSFEASSAEEALSIINKELEQLVDSARNHNLKININKSCVMYFGGRNNVTMVANLGIPIKINNIPLEIKKSCKNLGLILDDKLKYNTHINNLIRCSFAKLKLFYNYRDSIPVELKAMLCESLILSRFNYADVVYGPAIDKGTQNKIEKVQRACARFTLGLRKYDSVSNKIKNLGWLNMEQRRYVHLANFVHKIIVTGEPKYLKTLLTTRSTIHPINVRSNNLLSIPKFKSTQFKKSFTYSACHLYNKLPPHIKKCKKNKFKKNIRVYLNVSN